MAVMKVLFKAVDEISAKFDSMTRSGERALEAFESTGTAADGALGRASSTATSTARSLNAAADASNNLNATANETSNALGGTADAAAQAADEVGNYGDQSEEAGRQGEEFGRRSSDGVQSLQSVLASAGITVALKAIADGFMDCSQASAEFETSTAKVATIADTGQKSLGSISTEIRAFSNETGEAASDLAEATYQAISASVNTADSVAFSGSATKLAVGGFTSSAMAVDVLTTAINAYGLEASDATHLSDVLITTQNLGKTSVDQLAQSVGKVIPLASAYGVEMENLSAAYAVMTANGVATAETGTYLKAMLNELGDTGSAVASVLQEQTGQSFASLMESGYSLGDVLAVLGDGVNGDATAFNALWSSTEAGIGALSLFNAGAGKFNGVLDQMQNSVGATEKAYNTMADTTERSKQRMTNSFNNLKIATGDVLNPALSSVYETMAGIFAGMSDFVQEHPAVVAAVTAIAIGVGVFAGALAAYTLVTNIASIATAAWNAILLANPVVLIVAGVVALVAAVAALTAVLISQETEYESWTQTTQAQYDQLQDLNAEYDKACEEFGDTSTEAKRLRYEMDELNAEFEANKQTVEEFVAECDALVDSHNKLMDSYNSTTSEIKDNELGTLGLIQKLQDLASQNEKTAASEEQMKDIIQQLNADLPDLALSYDDVSKSAEASIEAMRKAAQAQADEELKLERQQAYNDLIKEQTVLEEQAKEAAENLRLSQEADINAPVLSDAWFYDNTGWLGTWATDTDEYKGALEELNGALAENKAALAEIEEQYANVAREAEEAANQTRTYEEMVSTAVESVQEELKTLCDEYDAAYEAARESIDGQIGLFDTMKTETELSISDMQAALQSQTEYLNLYTENLQKAAQYGLDDGLVQSLSDGSEESAGYINAIIENIEKLGGSAEGMPAEAATFVDGFNAKFSEVSQAKDEFAANVAAMETNFSDRMTEIETKMAGTITKLEMSTDAAAAARETISAYCNTIRSMTGEASSAAAAVAAAAQSQLGGISIPTVPGHANGTTSAEDVYVAGENGPELIIGAGGSEVFPAEETSRILSAINQRAVETSAGATTAEAAPEHDGRTESGNEKKLTLEINGGGAITVDKGTDKSAILEVLIENVKPILMSIIKEEIMEEGDLAYDY